VGLEEKKMPFNLFHKKKQPEQEQPAVTPQEEPKQEAPAPSTEQPQPEAATPAVETVQELPVAAQEPPQEPPMTTPEVPQETVAPPVEQKQEVAQPPPAEQKQEVASKTYLKAMPLRELSDLENIKTEVKNGNIIILRVTPLASKSIEDVKSAVNDLFQFAESTGGDIARLGEERVVICPKTIRIWREKTPAPVSSEPLPSAA
jgi:uncharacterized protein